MESLYNFDDQFTLRPNIDDLDGRSNYFNKYRPVDFKEFMDALIPAMKIKENIEKHLDNKKTQTTLKTTLEIHSPPTMVTFADYFKRYPHFEEHFIETLKLICKKYTIISNNTKTTELMNFRSKNHKIDLKTYLKDQLRGMYQSIDIYNEHSSPMLNTQVYCPLVQKLEDIEKGYDISAQVSPSISVPNALSSVNIVNEANNYGSIERVSSDNEASESEIIETRQSKIEKNQESQSFGESRQLDFGETSTPIVTNKNWTKPIDILHENDTMAPPIIQVNVTETPIILEVKNVTTVENTTEKFTIKKRPRRPPSEAAKATAAFLRSLGNHENTTRKSPIVMRPFSIMMKNALAKNRAELFSIRRPNILKKNYTRPTNTSANLESRAFDDDSMTIDNSDYGENFESIASGSENLDSVVENSSNDEKKSTTLIVPEIHDITKNETKNTTISNINNLNETLSILENYIEIQKEKTVIESRTENNVEIVSEKVLEKNLVSTDEAQVNEKNIDGKQDVNTTILNPPSAGECLTCFTKFNVSKTPEVSNTGKNIEKINEDVIRDEILKLTKTNNTDKIQIELSQTNNISITTENIVSSAIEDNKNKTEENIEGRNIISNSSTDHDTEVSKNETVITLLDVNFPTSNIEKGYDVISPMYKDLLPKTDKINMTVYKDIIAKIVNKTFTKNGSLILKKINSKNTTDDKIISDSVKISNSSEKFASLIESRENPDVFLTNETNKMDTLNIINETNDPIKTNKNIANVSIAKTPTFSQMLPFNTSNEFIGNSKKNTNDSESTAKNIPQEKKMGLPLLKKIYEVMNETKSNYITDEKMYTIQNFTGLFELENNATVKFNENFPVTEEINTTTVRVDSLTFVPESRRLEVVEVTTKQMTYPQNNQTEKSIDNTTSIIDHTENSV